MNVITEIMLERVHRTGKVRRQIGEHDRKVQAPLFPAPYFLLHQIMRTYHILNLRLLFSIKGY